MRRGDLLALRVGDVDLSGRDPFVTIRRALSASESTTPKSRRVRRVPLTDPAVAVLKPLCDGRDADALVLAGPDGKQLNGDALSRRFEEALKQAKHEPITKPDRDFDLD